MDRRLVDHLVNSNLITRAEMQRAILRAKKNKVALVEQLLASGRVSEEVLADAVAHCYGYDRLDTSSGFEAKPDAYNLLPTKIAKKHGVLPYRVSGSSVSIVIYAGKSVESVIATLKTATGGKPQIMVATRSFVESAIRHYYDGADWPEKPSAPAPIKAEKPSLVIIDEPPPSRFTRTRSRARSTAGGNEKPSVSKIPQPATRKVKPAARRPPPRPTSAPTVEKRDSVQDALADFDAFLDSGDFASSAPGIDVPTDDPLADAWSKADESRGGFDLSGWDDIQDDELPEAPAGGFDLFEPSEVELTINDLVDRHELAINKLHQELRNQREVVSTLVDMLVEGRILNRKELTRRVKAKRK